MKLESFIPSREMAIVVGLVATIFLVPSYPEQSHLVMLGFLGLSIFATLFLRPFQAPD